MEDQFDKLFKQHKDLDVFEPDTGHFERFESRLKKQKHAKSKVIRVRWQWMAVAASILLMLAVWFGNNNTGKKGLELADVSPKMEETQDFFMQTIRKEIKKVEKYKNAENEKIIADALDQLAKLETDYDKLKLELKESDENQLIIYAMINNFQKRIEILQNLMETIQDIEKVKQQKQIS